MKLHSFLVAGLSLLASLTAAPAATITSLDVPIVVNFDTWAGVLPTDFSLGGPTQAITYRGTSDTLNTGGTYNAQGFDFQASSNAASLTLTGVWQNNTGFTINTLTISYDAYVVFDRASRTPQWNVSSSSGFDLSGLTWTSTDGGKTLSVLIEGLSIAPGGTFDLTWATDRGTGSGSSPKIGLDNITVTAQAVPEPGTVALLACGLGLSLILAKRRRA